MGTNETVTKSLSRCKRCGTCCKKGGPVLHREDKSLLNGGPIKYEQLISIRKGEMAFLPLHDEPEPTAQELVKISGKGKNWECTFFNRQKNSCAIYDHRPLECRLLQCWETSALEAIVGHNTLARVDIITRDNPVMEFIQHHELECPVPRPDKLHIALSSEPEGLEALAELTELVRKDLAIRADAVMRFNIPLSLELFLFGRPLHTILNVYGLSVIENDGHIQITPRQASRFISARTAR